MISYVEKKIPGKDLELGFRGEFVHFRHREFEDRPDDHKKDYIRLAYSVALVGIKKPIIVFDNHILIGMRRYEIMVKFKPDHIFHCFVITEDVNKWTRDDLPRLDELKEHIGEVEY